MTLLVAGSTITIADAPATLGIGTVIEVDELAVIELLATELPTSSYVPTVIACAVGNVAGDGRDNVIVLKVQVFLITCPVVLLSS